VLEVLEIC